MTFFSYLKHKQKTLEFAWQHFGTQSSLWVKINFDPMVRWRGWNKIKVYRIYNLHFFTTIKPHVCASWNITKQKKTEKIMQFPSIKYFLLWYGNGFFPKEKILLCIYYSKMKKTHFFN